MSEEIISTKERLARALEERGNPRLKRMIREARKGFYDDFEGPDGLESIRLVKDLLAYGEEELAARAINGEFDSTKEESKAWSDSLDGMEAFDDPSAVAQVKEIVRQMHAVEGKPFNEAEFDSWIAEKRVGG